MLIILLIIIIFILSPTTTEISSKELRDMDKHTDANENFN